MVCLILITHYHIVLASPMAAQTDIPSALPDDDKDFIFLALDTVLNSRILYAILYGEHECSVTSVSKYRC